MSTLTIRLVDTLPALQECLADILPLPAPLQDISLAIDIEGVELCRHGRVSIIQIMSNYPDATIWLIDVTVLGREAFDHVDTDGRSLRAILEGTDIKKVFYDVRNDADALFHIYDVDMKNVYDLQILELAVRHSLFRPAQFLNGLGRSIESYVLPPRDWKMVKDAGIVLFDPKKGGSYSVFEQRPLDPRI